LEHSIFDNTENGNRHQQVLVSALEQLLRQTMGALDFIASGSWAFVSTCSVGLYENSIRQSYPRTKKMKPSRIDGGKAGRTSLLYACTCRSNDEWFGRYSKDKV